MCIIIFLLSTIFIGTNLSSHSPSGINSRGAYIIDLNSTTEYQHHSTTFYGHEAGDYSGNSIASADINDDGIDDVMVGAYWADGPANGRLRCGEVYVFFGGSFNETVDLTSDADMIIYGANSNDRLGQAITTGDVNGDAIQDLIFSASSADGVGEARLGCGEVYVLFGNDTFPATLDLLTTAPDIIIYGPEENDSCGYSLATGNVIGDTIDDILIGAYWGDGLGNAKLACGEVYLVEGVASYPPIIDLAFQVPVTIYGVTAYDYCGNAVTSGDVNNDNFDDIIIGAYGADGPGEARTSCGEVYLVYGNTTLPQTIDLAVNSDMLIYGTKRGSFGSYLGISLSSGDLNYDNFDDIVMGAYYEYVNTVNLGAVHVIYGNGSLPSSRDLMNIPGDVVIYGSDSLDRAGTKVVAADYDGDSFDDIILSASYADGPGNSRSGCGEIYIINGSSTIPSVINLTESEVDVIIYGNEGGDYVGQSLAVGKIDNDNGYDILIGANWADGPNNAKTGCGEVYLILSSDKYSPKLKTEFLGLTNGDGPDSKLCYAEYKPYSFKVRVTDPNGFTDVDSVTLGLDHGGENIKCKWIRQTQTFQELSDPNDYIELSSTSNSASFGLNSWILYFNITFNWLYPDNDLHGIQLYGDANSGLYGWLNLTGNIYQVENQVHLFGALDVIGDYQGEISHNDWIRGGESLYWKSIKIVYNGTTTYYPPTSAGADVTVWAPDGKSWTDNPLPGENITIQTTTENVTKEGVIYKINITGIPRYCDISNESFKFNIDNDIVIFSNPTPIESEWQNTHEPECGIVITDPTTIVQSSSIQYRVSTDDGLTWKNDWIDANIVAADDQTIECNVSPTLKNGITNLIQWRGKDGVGNNYNASEFYRINIDTEPVAFHNATPDSENWQADLSLDCGITIFDNLSGINASSIEYRISTEGINNYSSWQSVGVNVNSDQIHTVVKPTFQKGSDNYIQWRATDVVGNGPYESIDYQIKILLNHPPDSTLLSPTNGMIFQTQKPELLWEGRDHDGDKPLLFTVYLSTEEDKVVLLDPTALLALNTEETKFKFDIPLKDSATYYWTVIPNDGKIDGSCDSGIWHFKIDTSVEIPKVTLIAPFHNFSISSTNPELSWSVNYSQVDILKYNVFIDIKPDPENFIPDFDYISYIPTTPLVRGSTYYWTVIPIAESEDGTVQGECESGIWKFKVDAKPDRVYGLELDLETLNLNVEQGEDVITNITVRNTGNFPDIISLKLVYSDFQGFVELKEIEIPFTLNANQSKSIKLSITTYEHTEVRGYLIDIIAISQGARSELEDVSVTKTLQVRVTEQEASTGQDGTDKGEGDYFIWILVVIVVVIIILVAFFVVKRKKKEPEVAPEVDAEVLYKPSLLSDEVDTDQEKDKGKKPEMEVLTPDIEEQPEILTTKTYQPRLKPKVKKPRLQKTETPSEPVIDQIQEPGSISGESNGIQSQFDQMPTLEPEVVEGELVGELPLEVEESQPSTSVDVHLPGDSVDEPEVTLPDEQVDEGGPDVILPDEMETEKPIRKIKKGQKGLE